MISPHFPPDSNAGAHRVRLLAPYLQRSGWIPTILTVASDDYEGRLDTDLLELLPPELQVEHARALPARVTRIFGIGDLGLRSLKGLYSKAVELLDAMPHHAIFITIYPAWTALLGPVLKRRYQIPFVLDYQDPWVGAWGKSVGGGPDGVADLKSKLSRAVSAALEPRVLRDADAITAVSQGTIDDLVFRNPSLGAFATAVLPIGGDSSDFDLVRSMPRHNPLFDHTDGMFHVSCVGTLLPLGIATLRAVLEATGIMRERRPDLFGKLRLHFIGTSNERRANAAKRVLPHAAELGVKEVVDEYAGRIDYLDAVNVQLTSSALLLMGSSEPHYTASKLYPALLAKRPLLAVFHRDSSVSSILGEHASDHIRVVQYDDGDPVSQRVEAIFNELVSIMESRVSPGMVNFPAMNDTYTARHIAGDLASLLDRVSAREASQS